MDTREDRVERRLCHGPETLHRNRFHGTCAGEVDVPVADLVVRATDLQPDDPRKITRDAKVAQLRLAAAARCAAGFCLAEQDAGSRERCMWRRRCRVDRDPAHLGRPVDVDTARTRPGCQGVSRITEARNRNVGNVNPGVRSVRVVDEDARVTASIDLRGFYPDVRVRLSTTRVGATEIDRVAPTIHDQQIAKPHVLHVVTEIDPVSCGGVVRAVAVDLDVLDRDVHSVVFNRDHVLGIKRIVPFQDRLPHSHPHDPQIVTRRRDRNRIGKGDRGFGEQHRLAVRRGRNDRRVDPGNVFGSRNLKS